MYYYESDTILYPVAFWFMTLSNLVNPHFHAYC